MSDTPLPSLTLHLFGPFEALLNGAPLPGLRRRKARWLLALLALRAGREVECAWLAGLLWPEATEATALKNLRSSLADLRQTLGPAALRLRSPTSQTLCLDLTGAEADGVAFDAAIAAGDEASLERATALYRGPLLEGCAEEWAFQERQVRERAYLEALETLAARALARGEIKAAGRHLRQAVSADPLLESAQRALMQTLVAEGNYAAAVLAYRELRLKLHREINVAPDPETQALFQQLRAEAQQRAPGRAATAREQTVRQRPPPATPLEAVSRASMQPALPLRLPHPETSAAEELPLFTLQRMLAGGPLVGRKAELGTLQRQIEAAASARGSTLLLAGEPGIGKTRLVREASEYARQWGFRVLTGRCDEAGAAPYQPFAEALREYLQGASPEQAQETMPPPVACELVRLVPRMAEKVKDVPVVAPAASSGWAARQALVQATTEFFALLTRCQGPALLFLDDLHWADEGSPAMLHALARRARALPLLMVGTYRDLPPDCRHPLEQTLAALNRERAAERLPLRRLPEAAVAEMVTRALGSRLSAVGSDPDGRQPRADDPMSMAAFVSAVYQETEGNPFFIEEVLKHLVEEGAIFRVVGSATDEGVQGEELIPTRWRIKPLEAISVPSSVKVAIGRRLERLSEESRDAATLAAVIGPQFSFELLLEASGLEEEGLLETVEDWLGARLVVEEEESGPSVRERYRFHHALIREVLYNAVSLRRRAQLHERAGLALEAVYPNHRDAHLEELAHHFAHARSRVAMEKGVDYCLQAGKKAQSLAAHQEAIQPLAAALELLDGLPEDESHVRQRGDVVRSLWGAYAACGKYERGLQVAQEYLALTQRVGFPWCIAAAHFEMFGALKWSHFAAGIRGSENSHRILAEHVEKIPQIAEAYGMTDWLARARVMQADDLIGKNNPQAEALLREVLQSPEGVPREIIQESYLWLMEVCAVQEKWDEVAAALRQSIPFGEPAAPTGVRGGVFSFLGLMEEGMVRAGKRAEFVAFCKEAGALYAQAGLPLALHQWYLEPAAPSAEFGERVFRDDFDEPALRREWQWNGLAPVNSYSLTERPGYLSLRAERPAGLHVARMLLEIRGDFALETKMVGNWDECYCGASGLLVWKDLLNFVYLIKCARRHHGDISLAARVAGAGDCFGRGQLRGDTYHLRLERTGDQFTALCSTDGVQWLTCGQVVLPAQDPLRVGVWAGDGAMVHFDAVQLLGR